MNVIRKVLAYDPQPIIKEGLSTNKLNPYNRYQSYISAEDFFKAPEGMCLCGCNQPVPTKRHKWATNECAVYVYDILNIIRGVRETIFMYLSKMHGKACVECGITDVELEVDHIKPVMHGGGACWLDNYQLLCVECHKGKTKLDGKNNLTDNQIVKK